MIFPAWETRGEDFDIFERPDTGQRLNRLYGLYNAA
jgi:hypothetical protein